MSSLEICSICTEPKQISPIGPCNHSFCSSCKSNWLAVKRTCPVCRACIQVHNCTNSARRGNLFSNNKDLLMLSRLMGI